MQFWSSLTELQTTGSLPRGMIIGFKVHDPRLKYVYLVPFRCLFVNCLLRFPPKNAKSKSDPSGLPSISSPITTFPSTSLARSEIWDEDMRNSLKKPRYKKKDIDDRRSKVTISNFFEGTFAYRRVIYSSEPNTWNHSYPATPR